MPKKDRSNRVAFDLTPEIRERIKSLSIDLGVPQSQVAALLLLFALNNYEVSQDDLFQRGLLKKSSSPAYQYTIDLDKAKALFEK